MWDDSIIKYPGAPFQARRRYGARRIIRKNCAYRGKLRDNPQIARSGAIHRAAGRFARKPQRALSLDRPFFLRSAEERFTEIREAQIRKRRRGSAVRTRARTENQARGSAVLFALPRFLSTFLWKAQTRRDRAARERVGTDEPHCFLGTSRSRRARTGRQARSRRLR